MPPGERAPAPHVETDGGRFGVSPRGEGPSRRALFEVAEFFERCAPLIERTVDAMMRVTQSVGANGEPSNERKLPADIAGVYVVGGASSLPAWAASYAKTSARRCTAPPTRPHRRPSVSPSLPTKTPGFSSDKFARVFGVFREGHSGSEVAFDPIFRHEVLLPREQSDRHTVERTYRAAHNVGHFRYVECTEVDPSGHPSGDMASFSDIYFPFDSSFRGNDGDLNAIDVNRFDDNGPLIRETSR